MKQELSGKYGYGWDEHPNKEVKEIMNSLYGKKPEQIKLNRQQRRLKNRLSNK